MPALLEAAPAVTDPVVSVGATAPRQPGAGRSIRDRLVRIASKPGTLALLDQAIVSGTMFATNVVTGRSVSAADLGVYFIALNMLYFFRGVQEQLAYAPYMILGPRCDAASLPRFSGSVLVHLFVILACVAVLFAAQGFINTIGLGAASAHTLAVVLSVAGPVWLLREFTRQAAFARFEFAAAAAIDAVAASVQLLGLAALVVTGLACPISIFAVMAMGSGLAVASYVVGWRPRIRIEWSRVASDWHRNWRLSRWALASQLVSNTMLFAMPSIVAAWMNPAEAGRMAACCTLVGLAGMFVTGMSNVNAPQAVHAFVRGGHSDLWSHTRRASLQFAAALGLFTAVVWFGGESIVQVVYGGRFTGLAGPMTLFAIGILMNAVGIPAGNALCAMERPRLNFVADFSQLIATLLTCVVAVPTWGMSGAGLSLLAGYAVGSTVRWVTYVSAKEVSAKQVSVKEVSVKEVSASEVSAKEATAFAPTACGSEAGGRS
jgi:O-antigen/teichoic acid export membrane protein